MPKTTQIHHMVTLFLQNNFSKWLYRCGTNSQKTELVSAQAFCDSSVTSKPKGFRCLWSRSKSCMSYSVWLKHNRYFQILCILHFFFCYVIYVDNISHFGLSVCFWQLKKLVVFWCPLRFFTMYSKKWTKEIVLSFV